MTVQDSKTGKILFFCLHYVFPCGVVRTEKYRNKQGYRRRVKRLRAYEKIGLIQNLAV